MLTSTLGKTEAFTRLTTFSLELDLSNSLHLCFSSLLLVAILHPRFLTHQRVLGGMYGARTHKSLKRSLN